MKRLLSLVLYTALAVGANAGPVDTDALEALREGVRSDRDQIFGSCPFLGVFSSIEVEFRRVDYTTGIVSALFENAGQDTNCDSPRLTDT